MTPEAKKAWRVEAPSEGFADRVTSAILRDRVERRSRRPTRRWVLLAMVACALVAGGAWALGQRRVVPVTVDTALASVSSEPEPPPANGGALATPPVPGAVTTVAPHAPRPKAAVQPSASASASPPKVPYPSCRCNAFACDCGPEP